MKQFDFYIIDENQQIVDTISAFCKKKVHRPDRKCYWCLEHVDGILDNNLYFEEAQKIQMVDCYLDPNANPGKIREGCEEDFDFFMKNGYHRPVSQK